MNLFVYITKGVKVNLFDTSYKHQLYSNEVIIGEYSYKMGYLITFVSNVTP